jgi:general secretion pathway protein E
MNARLDLAPSLPAAVPNALDASAVPDVSLATTPPSAPQAAQPVPPVSDAAWDRWPVHEAMRLGVVLARTAQPDGAAAWTALTPAPDDDLLRAAVQRRLPRGARLHWQAVTPGELAAWLAAGEQAYAAMAGIEGAAGGDSVLRAEGAELSIQSITGQSSPVVKLLDATLFDALKAQASDLHLESTAQGMAIRYRLDGVMEKVGEVPTREMAEQLVSRLKVMAELDIGERRLPQDGRFKRRIATGSGSSSGTGSAAGEREVDFRVSIMPTSFGEDAVVRLLDRSKLAEDRAGLTLAGLGFDAADVQQILRLAAQPYGMLLVTGPTGSGKTTTLYAVIAQTQDGRDKLITIEDPVEYQLPGVVQIPVNEKKGLTFARGLRSILRHDPDRVMVGEIRDAETAQIAAQAALTGHLVLTTVHANSSFDVIGRFMHMGLDLYNVVAALNGVVAQRLMRKLCTACAQPWQPQPADLKAAGLPLDAGARGEGRFMRAVGCPACRHSGYRGRRAVAEILLMDDTLRDLIVQRQSLAAIKAHARASGTRLLREAALAAVLRGESTLEELNRVTLVD